jgi:hypothetical protein
VSGVERVDGHIHHGPDRAVDAVHTPRSRRVDVREFGGHRAFGEPDAARGEAFLADPRGPALVHAAADDTLCHSTKLSLGCVLGRKSVDMLTIMGGGR